MAVEVEREDEAQAEAGTEAKKSRLPLVIIGSIITVVIVLAALFLFVFSGDSEEGQVYKGLERTEGGEVSTAYYVALPRPFIFNVPGQRHDRLVQINVQLMVRGKRNDDFTRQNIPLIEGILHRTFSAATAESLQTSEGRLQLRESALNIIRNEFLETTGNPVIEEILFTGFVMQ